MADVVVQQVVVLRVTDLEWRLIMKSLAFFAGLKMSIKTDDKARAAELNKQLLVQRVGVLKEQLKVAEGALSLADVQSEDPGDSADVTRMAFSVGRQMGKRDAEKEAEEE